MRRKRINGHRRRASALKKAEPRKTIGPRKKLQ